MYKKWAGFLLLFIAILLLCASGILWIENLRKYHFSDQNNHNYKIQLDHEQIKIQGLDEKAKTAKILMFAWKDDKDLSVYLQSLKNLHEDYTDLRILAILKTHKNEAELAKFIKNEGIDFLVLNPSDGKDLLGDLRQILPHQANTQPQPENSSQALTQDLPFFLLYDAKGRLYQYYQGYVAQEMVMFDIGQMQDEGK